MWIFQNIQAFRNSLPVDTLVWRRSWPLQLHSADQSQSWDVASAVSEQDPRPREEADFYHLRNNLQVKMGFEVCGPNEVMVVSGRYIFGLSFSVKWVDIQCRENLHFRICFLPLLCSLAWSTLINNAVDWQRSQNADAWIGMFSKYTYRAVGFAALMQLRTPTAVCLLFNIVLW